MENKKQTAITLPRCIEDVDADWLTGALGSLHPGVAVTSARVDPFLGYKPNKARIHLQYNAAGKAVGLPPSMIVKATFPGRESSGQELDWATAAEATSYRDVTHRLGVNTPHVYFLGLDFELGRTAMLLEDLALKNVTFLNAFTPLHYGAAAGFVDGLARIHSTFWNGDVFAAGGEFGPGSAMANSRQSFHAAVRDFISASPRFFKTMRSHRELPRAAVLPQKYADQARLEAAVLRLLEVLRNSPLVMIHGDEHLGNLYLEADGSPGFIDWFARPEPWSIGFAYFMASTLDMLDRRQWERPLLALYLQRLQAYGVAAPSFEQAWFEYRCSIIWPMMTWFVNPGEWQPERINTVNVSRATLAAIDHDVFSLLGI